MGQIIVPSTLFLLLEKYVLLNYFNLNSVVTMLVSMAIYVIVYYCYSLMTKMDYLEILKPIIKKR